MGELTGNAQESAAGAFEIVTKSVRAPAEESDGYRVLCDRLWPRGVSRAQAALDEWAKELAPSDELRRWFAHKPERFAEFRRRYRAELAERRAAAEALLGRAGNRRLTLLFGARDQQHNNAVVLAEFLRELKADSARQ